MKKAIEMEIKDLYDGSFASIKELSILFKIDKTIIMYFLDYKGQKEKQDKATRIWQVRNPEKVKEISNKASKKWQSKNKEKVIAYRKKYNARPDIKLKAHKRYLKTLIVNK